MPASNRERMRLLRAVKRGSVKRPKPHLYAPTPYWVSLTRYEQALHLIRATARRRPEWTFCYLSAALVWGLTETVFLHAQMHVAAKNHTHVRVGGSIKSHFCLVPKPKKRNGVSVTPLVQTVYDCARRLDYGNALAICETAMRLYGVKRRQLEAYANARPHTWGRDRALYVFAQAGPLSENGGESIARARFDGWGYAAPKQQVSVERPFQAGKRLRLDFLWTTRNGRLVAGELDGREKYINPAMTGGGSVADVILKEKRQGDGIITVGLCDCSLLLQAHTRKAWDSSATKTGCGGSTAIGRSTDLRENGEPGGPPFIRQLLGSDPHLLGRHD